METEQKTPQAATPEKTTLQVGASEKTIEVLERLKTMKPHVYRSNTATVEIALHELYQKEIRKNENAEPEA